MGVVGGTHLYGRRLVVEWADPDDGLDEIRAKTASKFERGDDDVRTRKASKLAGGDGGEAPERLGKRRKAA